ncbi:uncharacterized protein LOC114676959 isoform X2 [Macaca mulatta]|uniref:uncharacterized protein LOC114676959 isoform X2 n=1 Tax=Macaca mulatta TaxID=9544 RepID=UPI0010A28F44|nr:uncharacterized protein LOC114676959 isoform X2 [Macaca mulatta]
MVPWNGCPSNYHRFIQAKGNPGGGRHRCVYLSIRPSPKATIEEEMPLPYTVILSMPTAVRVQGLPHWVHRTRVKLTPKGNCQTIQVTLLLQRHDGYNSQEYPKN